MEMGEGACRRGVIHHQQATLVIELVHRGCETLCALIDLSGRGNSDGDRHREVKLRRGLSPLGNQRVPTGSLALIVVSLVPIVLSFALLVGIRVYGLILQGHRKEWGMKRNTGRI